LKRSKKTPIRRTGNEVKLFLLKEDRMTVIAEPIFNEALSLPTSEIAQLAERFFSSLEISQEELDRLWGKEADSRIDAHERGELKAISAYKVFKNIQ
jgi:putative addiction module component (TIGR02574 family)